MPGEEQMLREFVSELEPRFLGQVVEVVFEKMKLAREAGSLLKIEEDIRGAVAAAKNQWIRETGRATDRKGHPLLFTQVELDKLAGKAGQPSLFDLTGITDEQFFERAESNVIEALRTYAEKTHNGLRLQRRLFADDAEHGFAFVDVCQKRFDVVLMNPPFGEPSTPSKAYVAENYATSRDDVDAGFVHRGMLFLNQGGLLGAITNRTQFFKPALRQWREDILVSTGHIDAAADLGFGVLDSALVEAAAYTARPHTPSTHGPSVFFRLLKSDRKSADLLSMIKAVQKHRSEPMPEIFFVDPSSFLDFPESRIAYWASPAIRKAFRSLPSLGGGLGVPQFGVSTKDDFRFLRLLWEIPPSKICITAEACASTLGEDIYSWAPFAKGGEYSPYYGDIHLAIDWTQLGGRIGEYVGERYPYLKGNVSWVLHPESDYFQSGLTYTRRTTSGFSPRFLPKGCVFSDQGIAILTTPRNAAGELLAVLMTRVVASFVEMMVESGDAVTSGSAARRYETNIASSIPVPVLTPEDSKRLRSLATKVWELKRSEEGGDETGRYFVAPTILLTGGAEISTGTLKELVAIAWNEKEKMDLLGLEATWEIECLVRHLYGFDAATLQSIDREMGVHPFALPASSQSVDENAVASTDLTDLDKVIDQEVGRSGGSRAITKKSYYVDRRLEILSAVFQIHPSSIVKVRRTRGLLPKGFVRSAVEEVISYFLGCVLGRWYMRTDQTYPKVSSEPSDAVPICAAGMLIGLDGLPSNETPGNYPFRVTWGGVCPEDSEHPEDVVRQVRDGFDLIWKDRADAMEKEASDLLGVKELRDYFRKPGKGGFWVDHVSRYSKSRRKAPIYWLLQSSNKNYSLWLYYHRLDKDLLFKAFVNYVEPKIRLETNRLETLRSQKTVAVASGKDAKRIAKEVEQVEDFLSELRDFGDKLRE